MTAIRGMDLEAEVLEVMRDLAKEGAPLTVKDIASRFAEVHREELDRAVTPKWIGGILRRKLGLKPEKSHGSFVLPLSEFGKLPRLYEKYGIEESG
jgi:hypothetical protein